MASYKKGNTWGKSFLAIIAIICLVLDGWFLYIHFFGKEKIVSTTATISDMEVQKVDQVTGEVTTEKKTFMEINWYDNCIEIKFNQLYDENQTAFYSYGVQLMVKDGIDKTLTSENIFDGNYNKEIYSELAENNKLTYSSWHYLQRCKIYHDVYNKVLTEKNYKYLDLYEYQSFDNYETPLQSTFLQNGDGLLKLQVKDGQAKNIIALKFKNYDTEIILDGLDSKKQLVTKDLIKIGTETNYMYDDYGFLSIDSYYDENIYYRAKDIYYLIESLSNSVKGLAPGFIGETYLKTPDVFDLYEYDETKKQYLKTGGMNDFTGKLTSEEIIYSKIKLTVHEGALTKSSQSLFNKYREIQNYDSSPSESDMTNYLSGKTIITATLDDLFWRAVSESGKYIFSLSDEFKARWSKYINTSYFRVVIDTEFLTANSLSYAGFDFDEDFFIYQIKTTSGEIWYQEVANA